MIFSINSLLGSYDGKRSKAAYVLLLSKVDR
jgi:hypothetical protein